MHACFLSQVLGLLRWTRQISYRFENWVHRTSSTGDKSVPVLQCFLLFVWFLPVLAAKTHLLLVTLPSPCSLFACTSLAPQPCLHQSAKTVPVILDSTHISFSLLASGGSVPFSSSFAAAIQTFSSKYEAKQTKILNPHSGLGSSSSGPVR